MTLFHIRQRISNGNMMLATQTGNLREGKLFLGMEVNKKVLVYFKLINLSLSWCPLKVKIIVATID